MGLEAKWGGGGAEENQCVLHGNYVLPSHCPNVNSDTRDTKNSIFVAI